MGPEFRHRRAWLATMAALLLCAEVARAAEATCRATRVGGSARVAVTLEGLLDRDLLRLVRLGLKGRLAVELRAVRKGLLFGRTVGRAALEVTLAWSEELEALLLDGRPVRDPRTLELERISLDVDAPEAETVTVETSARLQVVTAQSLGDVARWITGGDSTAPERSALTRNVIGAVAEDLTRSASCTCPARPRAAP